MTQKNFFYCIAAGSLFYIFKTTFDLFKSTVKNKKDFKQMIEILEQEKKKTNLCEILQNKKSDQLKDTIFYSYFKILHTVYHREFSDFNKKRRKLFAELNVPRYVAYVQYFYKQMKPVENYIIDCIYDHLKINRYNDIFKNDNYDFRYLIFIIHFC
jgi:hypothetical protein